MRISRTCPACGHQAADVGWVIVTELGGMYVVVGRCSRCARMDRTLPPSVRVKRQRQAVQKAAALPGKYLCTTFSDAAPARLSKAMMANPEFTEQTMAALGWLLPLTDPT